MDAQNQERENENESERRRKAAEFWADEIRPSQTSYLIREESAGGPAVIRRMLLF